MTERPTARDNLAAELARANIAREARALAGLARVMGMVLTIEQVNQKPLASGNHVDVVTVRPARKPDSTY